MIEELAAKAAAGGRMPPRQRKRIMSYPLTIRLTVAMTLMPDASYAEALRRLAGLLAEVPFAREWHVPGSKVITCWRGMVPPSVLEELFWRAAGPLVAADAPSAVMLAGLPVCAIDGMLVAVADTPANRKAFGCAGTSREHGTGAAPFPHIQAVLVTARAGRATLGAIIGRARAGEQTLLARLIRRRPELFRGRVFVFDRNFPGHAIITAILEAGGHVVARIKDGISLSATEGGWLADGSRISYLNAQSGKKGDRLRVRVAEHNVVLSLGDGQQVSGTCTLATTLLDHRLASAEQIRDAYRMRWSASETTFGEDKTALVGAGDRTSGPVLRSGSPRLAVQEFWAWLIAIPAGARQRGGGPGHRCLHHGTASCDPVGDLVPGHRGHVPARHGRRGRRRSQRRAAHADHHRAAAALPARAEGSASVPAHRVHQEDRDRNPADHPVRTPPAIAKAQPERP